MRKEAFYSLVCLMALGGSCRSSSEVEERRARVAEAVAVRSEQQRIAIPAAPRDLTSDYSKPALSVRQLFRWAPHETLWRWTIIDPSARYAGFLIRRPVDVPSVRTGMALYFELSPPDLAPSLAVGLIDDPNRPHQEQPVLDLVTYAFPMRRADEAIAFALPLSDFEALHDNKIDWSNIQGVHLQRAPGVRDEVRRIDLRNLQLVPDTWLNEMRWEP